MAQSISQEAIGATGLPGATASSRHAGATASGAPATGSFLVGDYVVDQTGAIYICTVAGTPGTWVLTKASTITGANAALTGPIENVTITSTAVSGAMTLTVSGGANTVNLYTTNASGNFSFNIAGPGTLLVTGQAISVAALTNQGSTAYYCTAVTIDGTSSGVTLWWQGGAAPTAGNVSGIDSYVFTVIKTGSGTYTVLAALTQF